MLPTIFGLAFIAGAICAIGAVVAAFRKRRKRGWIGGFAFFFVVMCITSVNLPRSGSTAVAPPADAPANENASQPDSTATDSPAPRPPSTRQLKAKFIASVDEAITGKRIAGNPAKFYGKNVELHGQVVNVLDGHSFNFQTGTMNVGDDGNVSDTEATLLITCDSTTSLEADQKLRILGTVVESTQGTNAMGGTMEFPTVKASYLE